MKVEEVRQELMRLADEDYLVNQLPYKYIYAKKKVLHFLF